MSSLAPIESTISYLTAATGADAGAVEAVSLFTLEAFIGRRARHPWASEISYPGGFLFIVGPSSRARKSSLLSKAEGILGEHKQDMIAPTDFTPEGLTKMLSDAKGETRLVIDYEIGSSLSRLSRRDYLTGTKGLLCALWDHPPMIQRALAQKTVKAVTPTLTIIGASTGDALADALEESDWTTGFLARTILIPAGPASHIPYTQARNGMRAAKNAVLDGLQAVDLILEKGTKVVLKPDAETAFVAWDDAWYESPPEDPRLEGIHARARTMTIRLVITLAVSDQAGLVVEQMRSADSASSASSLDSADSADAEPDESAERHAVRILEVDRDTVERATALMEKWFGLYSRVADVLARTEIERRLERILDAVRRRGGRANRSAVMRVTRGLSRTFRDDLDTLEGRGLIRRDGNDLIEMKLVDVKKSEASGVSLDPDAAVNDISLVQE